jgi:hypothetical protein
MLKEIRACGQKMLAPPAHHQPEFMPDAGWRTLVGWHAPCV